MFLDLKEGQPQHIELFHFMYRTPITIKFSAEHSHVVLLINSLPRDKQISNYFENFPWLDDYQMRVDLTREQLMMKKTLEITDKAFCDNCRYLMTIFTTDPGCKVEFIASYKSNFSHINLEPGKQLIDS